MDQTPHDDRLSRISTLWTQLRQAHESGEVAVRARQELMHRYCGAAYRYLLKAVRDPHLAEDLSQEFALRFIKGRFKHAAPDRGRFRDYVKTALFHLVDDHYRKLARAPKAAAIDGQDPAAPGGPPDADVAFRESWSHELLARTWRGLAEWEAQTGQPYHTVLRLRAENPDLPSATLGDRLGGVLGKPVSADAARQTLHRAREKFTALLIDEVRQSLGEAADDVRVEEELAELNLLRYCQGAKKPKGPR